MSSKLESDFALIMRQIVNEDCEFDLNSLLNEDRFEQRELDRFQKIGIDVNVCLDGTVPKISRRSTIQNVVVSFTRDGETIYVKLCVSFLLTSFLP